MKVAAVVEQVWHRVPGGTARATIETLRALTASTEGLTAEELDITGIAAWHRPSRRSPVAGTSRVRYYPLPRPVLYESWLASGRDGGLARLLYTATKAGANSDLVWASSGISPPSDRPIVATIHDLEFLNFPEFSSRRGRSFFPRMWEVTRDRADLIVCPSQVVADQCHSLGVELERLAVVPWGVAPQSTTSASRPSANMEVNQRFGLPQPYVLWVGTLEPRKNLSSLVAAVEQLPDTHLAVVGPTGWNQDHANLASSPGDRIHFLGRVDDETLGHLYRGASVFVFPSLAEGFGLPVLEAMVNGVPVITSATTATAEVARDAGILVEPTDIDQLAHSIEMVLNNPDLAQGLIEQGRQRAAQLTWDRTAAGYLASFRQVTGSASC